MIRRLPAAALLSAGLALGCSRSAPPAPETTAVVAAARSGYSDELAAAQRRVADAGGAIARGPVVWPQWETLALAQLALAQLSGDPRAYLDADKSLVQAFAMAGQGGPYLTRARYHFAVHRLDRVDADLDAAERESNPDRSAILGLRADLDFYRGRYPQALAGYRAALARREDIAGLVRLALWHARMGHLSEALALLDRADAIYHGDSPHPRAWLALQRGLLELDRGRWEHALAHYLHALRLLPGWWLAREHVAEIHALQGNAALARQEYEAVIAETGNPEYMDAMATLAEQEGKPDEAVQWIARARTGYDQRLAQLPEATYGHGLDHFLQFGPPEMALQLARANHRQRPNGEAQIKLSEALLLNNQPIAALAMVRAALASGWNTPELHAVAARSYAAAGHADQARTALASAISGNPRAVEQFGLDALRRQLGRHDGDAGDVAADQRLRR